jgi:tRNA A37 threonylcarbamoyladenosine synthetase subunit TsaC/SUA5/YrdC
MPDIGANPSAEEQEEALDDTKQTVIDVVHSFRLNETSFDKKSYLSHLKSKTTYLAKTRWPQPTLTFVLAYMKKVKEGMKERGADEEKIKSFESNAQAYAKKIIANFKDYEFLIGESMDPDGM